VFPYIQQLNAAFETAEIRGKQTITGLHSGILSRRRLHRIFYDDRVFEKRVSQRKLDLALFVLLDASQSIANDWPLLEELSCAFVEVLKGKPEVSLEIAAYQGAGECRFTSIYNSSIRQLCLGGLSPSGRTPTGEALLTAGLFLQGVAKRTKVILHCTDGEPDRVATVKEAVSQLDQWGIRIISLSTQQKNSSLLEDCYKGRFQTIGSLANLPDAILKLLASLLTTNAVEF
jgi:nitric oxide reductase activation protein